jgi:hypothetical protein
MASNLLQMAGGIAAPLSTSRIIMTTVRTGCDSMVRRQSDSTAIGPMAGTPDTWHGSLGRPLTEAERAELDRWMAQRRAEQEKKAAELADEARQLAQRVWGKADDASASQHQRSHRVLRSCGV